MQLVSSVYIKTLFANALGCSIDAELDTALTISDGACSFTLRLHDFDLASVLETSPKFTLTADDVCIFILCADDDTKLQAYLTGDPFLASFVNEMRQLPPAAAALLTSDQSAPVPSVTATDSLCAAAHVTIKGSFFEDLFQVGYPDDGQANERLFLAAIISNSKDVNLKDALFVAALPDFKLFGLLSFSDIAASFTLAAPQPEPKSREQAASGQIDIFVAADFDQLNQKLQDTFAQQITKSFYLQGKITLELNTLRLVFGGKLELNNCYCLGEIDLYAEDASAPDPERHIALLGDALEFFHIRLVAASVNDTNDDHLSLAFAAEVNLAGVELEAALTYAENTVQEAGICLNSDVTLATLLDNLAHVKLDAFDIGIKEGSYVNYINTATANTPSYTVAILLNLALKILIFDLSCAIKLAINSDHGKSSVSGQVQLEQQLNIFSILILRAANSNTAVLVSDTLQGPLCYFATNDQQVIIGFKGELVLLCDIHLPFDFAITRSSDRESIVGTFTFNCDLFRDGKLDFTLAYVVDKTSNHETFKVELNTPLDLPDLNVLKDICECVDNFGHLSSCKSMKDALSKHINDKKAIAHKISPKFSFSDDKSQLNLSVVIILGTGDLSNPDNVFINKTITNALHWTLSADLSFNSLITETINQIPDLIAKIFTSLFQSEEGDTVNVFQFLTYLFPDLGGAILSSLACNTKDPDLNEKAKRDKKTKPEKGRHKAKRGRRHHGGRKLGWTLAESLFALGLKDGIGYDDLGLLAGSLLASGAFVGFESADSDDRASFAEAQAADDLTERLAVAFHRGCIRADSLITMADGTTKPIASLVRGAKVMGSDGEAHTVLALTKTPLWDVPVIKVQYGSLSPLYLTVLSALRTNRGYKALMSAPDGFYLQPQELVSRDGVHLTYLGADDVIWSYDAATGDITKLPAHDLTVSLEGAASAFYYDLILDDPELDFFVNGLALHQDLWSEQSFFVGSYRVPDGDKCANLSLLRPYFTFSNLTLAWMSDLQASSCDLEFKVYDVDCRGLSPEALAAHELSEYAFSQSELSDDDAPIELAVPIGLAEDRYCQVLFRRTCQVKSGMITSRDGRAVIKITGFMFAARPAYYSETREIAFTLESSAQRALVNIWQADKLLAQNLEVPCGQSFSYTLPPDLQLVLSDDDPVAIEACVCLVDADSAQTLQEPDGSTVDELFYCISPVGYALITQDSVRPEPEPGPEPGPEPEPIIPEDYKPIPDGTDLLACRTVLNDFKLNSELLYYMHKSAEPSSEYTRYMYWAYIYDILMYLHDNLDLDYLKNHEVNDPAMLALISGNKHFCYFTQALISLGMSPTIVIPAASSTAQTYFDMLPDEMGYLNVWCDRFNLMRQYTQLTAAYSVLYTQDEIEFVKLIMPHVSAFINAHTPPVILRLILGFAPKGDLAKLGTYMIAMRSATLLSWDNICKLMIELGKASAAEIESLSQEYKAVGIYSSIPHMIDNVVSYAHETKVDASYIMQALQTQQSLPKSIEQSVVCMLINGYATSDIIHACIALGMSPLKAQQLIVDSDVELHQIFVHALYAMNCNQIRALESLKWLLTMPGSHTRDELFKLMTDAYYPSNLVDEALDYLGF